MFFVAYSCESGEIKSELTFRSTRSKNIALWRPIIQEIVILIKLSTYHNKYLSNPILKKKKLKCIKKHPFMMTTEPFSHINCVF